MRSPRLILPLAAVLGLVAWAAAACGDDDDTDPEPAPTVTATPSAGPGTPTATQGANPPNVTVTVIPTPAGATADSLARSPQYVLYEAGEGDTVAFIAAAFSGTTGPTPAGFADQIMQLNRLTGDKVPPGLTLVIPLRRPASTALMPASSFETAIGVGGKAGKLTILQPNQQLRDGLLGKVALHRVALADGTPAREEFGFLTEYWLTDRTPVKGGEADPDARKADPGFIIAGGTYAESLAQTREGDLYRFERDGVQYAVKVLRGVTQTAAALAALLELETDK